MRKKTPLIIILFLLVPITTLMAASWIPANMEKLTSDAQVIVHGSCLSVEEDLVYSPSQKKQLNVLIVTIQVEEVVKDNGRIQENKLQWTQVAPHQEHGAIVMYPPPKPIVGQSYWFFLTKANKMGLTRVAGFREGIFQTEKRSDGKVIVKDPLGRSQISPENKSLTKSISKNPESSAGEIDNKTFIKRLKGLTK